MGEGERDGEGEEEEEGEGEGEKERERRRGRGRGRGREGEGEGKTIGCTTPARTPPSPTLVSVVWCVMVVEVGRRRPDEMT